jgi:hypothetical protein
VGRVIPVGRNGVELITSHTREPTVDDRFVTFVTELAILDGIARRRANRNPRRLRQSHLLRETSRSGDGNGEGDRRTSCPDAHIITAALAVFCHSWNAYNVSTVYNITRYSCYPQSGS